MGDGHPRPTGTVRGVLEGKKILSGRLQKKHWIVSSVYPKPALGVCVMVASQDGPSLLASREWRGEDNTIIAAIG